MRLWSKAPFRPAKVLSALITRAMSASEMARPSFLAVWSSAAPVTSRDKT